MRHGIKLSKKQSPKTDEELKRMSNIPYASAVGSIQYAVQCSRPDVAYALSVTNRYEACTGRRTGARSRAFSTRKLNTEAAKEAIWMKNYIQESGVVPSIAETVVIFCDNNGAIAQTKEPTSHHRSKHILRRYHLLGRR
ncbi:UNVERIFIED_CONTAM: Retrovirus-related Pol polyprotein from transposon TNT 1-94 [Sesamum radiatum]|uniref:Retrovirus-related Pol polyprotein from transposon TNT 1-94 n=1 Tax=Sesamum radiatum TaxID=300843 RepID=A0AAW2Q0P7_SESRA